MKNQISLSASDKFRLNFDELRPFYYKQKIPGYIHRHSLDQHVLKLSCFPIKWAFTT